MIFGVWRQSGCNFYDVFVRFLPLKMFPYSIFACIIGQICNPKMSSLAYHFATTDSWRRLLLLWGFTRISVVVLLKYSRLQRSYRVFRLSHLHTRTEIPITLRLIFPDATRTNLLVIHFKLSSFFRFFLSFFLARQSDFSSQNSLNIC